MTVYVTDADSGDVVGITSRTVGSDEQPIHGLPDAVEEDIADLASTVLSGAIKAVLQAGSAAIGKLAANAGVIIGDVNVVAVPATSAGPYTTQGTVGTSSAQLASQALQHGVRVRNLHATQTLYYGDSGVTTANGYVVKPGEDTFVPCANRNQVWLIASGASTTYCTSGS